MIYFPWAQSFNELWEAWNFITTELIISENNFCWFSAMNWLYFFPKSSSSCRKDENWMIQQTRFFANGNRLNFLFLGRLNHQVKSNLLFYWVKKIVEALGKSSCLHENCNFIDELQNVFAFDSPSLPFETCKFHVKSGIAVPIVVFQSNMQQWINFSPQLIFSPIAYQWHPKIFRIENRNVAHDTSNNNHDLWHPRTKIQQMFVFYRYRKSVVEISMAIENSRVNINKAFSLGLRVRFRKHN